MRIEGSYTFHAPLELVWNMFNDPPVMEQALPYGRRFDQLNATEFSAAIEIDAGPLRGQFTGVVKVHGVEPLAGYDILLEGMGPEGPVQGRGYLAFEAHGEQTRVAYVGDVSVSARVARESPRLLHTSANALIRKYMEGMQRQIEAQTQVHTTQLHSTLLAQRKVRRWQAGESTLGYNHMWTGVRRSPQIVLLLLALLVPLFLMVVGAFVTVRSVLRWMLRPFLRALFPAEQPPRQIRTAS